MSGVVFAQLILIQLMPMLFVMNLALETLVRILSQTFFLSCFFAEPVVFNSSYFGDGDGAIIYSGFSCRGYEQTVAECVKMEYGSFTCSRDSVVGIICQSSKQHY